MYPSTDRCGYLSQCLHVCCYDSNDERGTEKENVGGRPPAATSYKKWYNAKMSATRSKTNRMRNGRVASTRTMGTVHTGHCQPS